jgi:hypothetical protein
MDKSTFEFEMGRADVFKKYETDRSEYWIGYQRGLRRAYHGKKFGTPEEHNLWLNAIYSEDTLRKQRGQGYRDGLKGTPTNV